MPKDLGNLRSLHFLTSLTKCKSLRRLWIQDNPLKGHFPNSFGNLSVSLESIDASSCQIKGVIPTEIGNLSNLMALNLGDNELTGMIPTTLGQLQKLQQLIISGNRIHGSIPNDLCYSANLGSLLLSSSEFSGPVPSCFGNLTALQQLFLDSNTLASQIPSSLWSLRGILYLNLSSNFLNGNLPLEIGNMKTIIKLDLSKNQFSGYIPSSIRQLQNLVELSLPKNNLQGPIPLKFGDLVSLESLDLSWNNLSGTIPQSLEALIYLKHLNVSFNKRQGEIRNGGPFVNFTAKSFISNEALCGAPRFQVMACKKVTTRKSTKAKSLLLKCVLPTIASTIIILALIILLIRRQKRLDIPIQVDSSLPITYRKISHQELLHASNYFSEGNLIGKGSMGTVYKGVLFDGLTAAIKVFNLEFLGSFKGFEAECEVMRNICHRNLIKIISSCSNLGFKALVLEFMPNGSLERWLYSHNYCLDLIQRLNITIDVASALEYLHHDYSNPVVHCDLKPNNVLLDEDRVAHVGDFGIAKLLPGSESRQQTKTLCTIGYMAPGKVAPNFYACLLQESELMKIFLFPNSFSIYSRNCLL